MGLIGLLILAACMIVVLKLVMGGRSGTRNWDLRAGGDLPKVVLLEGLVGALAMVGVLGALDSGSVPLASIGAAMGLITAVAMAAAGWAALDTVLQYFYAGIGVLAAIMSIADMFEDDCRPTVPSAVLMVLVALIAGLYFLSSFFGFANLKPSRIGPAGLGWFAAVEGLAMLATPFGESLFPGEAWYYVGMIAFAVIVGVGLGLNPEVMFIVVGSLFTLAAVAGGTMEGADACIAGAGTELIVVMASFAAVFVLVRMATRVFAR